LLVFSEQKKLLRYLFNRAFAVALSILFLSATRTWADAYDPPPTYYATATGTGATLKTQLHNIIDGHTALSYDSANSNLQVTDADPNNPGHMLSAYDRVSIDVASINPGGSPPGWDSGKTWNKEHTWPQSRGITDTNPLDGSDLFELRPTSSGQNSSRGNLNYGGAFGQPFGRVTDNGVTYWYPGDADAGMIARQEFYMAVRYDGTDPGTTDLELASGNPDAHLSLMGNLDRLIEWHFMAPPDDFERRRNQSFTPTTSIIAIHSRIAQNWLGPFSLIRQTIVKSQLPERRLMPMVAR
jgi:endonuclease I